MSQLEGEAGGVGESPPLVRPPDNRGGRREGAGRKRRGHFAPNRGDLDYARDLVSDLMRDEDGPAELRARLAMAVLIRGTSVRYSSRS